MLLCTDNAEIFRHIVQNDNFSTYWNTCDNNVILQCSAQLENRMIEIVDEIIPSLRKGDMILDIGCSDGMMDERVSGYCNHIDAFDYSEASIKEARRRAGQKGINNISFEVADAKEMIISKKYDFVFLLGLTVYFEKDEDVVDIINKIHECLHPHGRVLIKDSLNIFSDKNIYHVNFLDDYQACYRPMGVYEKYWQDAGFRIIKKVILADDMNIGIVKKYSIGYLVEKLA